MLYIEFTWCFSRGNKTQYRWILTNPSSSALKSTSSSTFCCSFSINCKWELRETNNHQWNIYEELRIMFAVTGYVSMVPPFWNISSLFFENCVFLQHQQIQFPRSYVVSSRDALLPTSFTQERPSKHIVTQTM